MERKLTRGHGEDENPRENRETLLSELDLEITVENIAIAKGRCFLLQKKQ